MTKTVIAYEDDADLRKQLESVFYSIRDEFNLIATFPNPIGITAEINVYKPDIVLMDLNMLEEDDGLVALYKVKRTAPQIKVMVLTMFDVDHKVFDAICLGADGYMLKSDFLNQQMPHEAMRRSLKMIFEDKAYLTPSVAKQILNLFSDQSLGDRMNRVKARFQALFQKESGKGKGADTGLTRMQTSVLQYIVDGLTTSRIAREMNLSENTVNSHIKAIYATLGVHSRALAIRKAIENRWFS